MVNLIQYCSQVLLPYLVVCIIVDGACIHSHAIVVAVTIVAGAVVVEFCRTVSLLISLSTDMRLGSLRDREEENNAKDLGQHDE